MEPSHDYGDEGCMQQPQNLQRAQASWFFNATITNPHVLPQWPFSQEMQLRQREKDLTWRAGGWLGHERFLREHQLSFIVEH